MKSRITRGAGQQVQAGSRRGTPGTEPWWPGSAGTQTPATAPSSTPGWWATPALPPPSGPGVPRRPHRTAQVSRASTGWPLAPLRWQKCACLEMLEVLSSHKPYSTLCTRSVVPLQQTKHTPAHDIEGVSSGTASPGLTITTPPKLSARRRHRSGAQ